MEPKHLCDSCNGEFLECMGILVESAIGPKFLCDKCQDIYWDEDDGQENDDPMTYKEDY